MPVDVQTRKKIKLKKAPKYCNVFYNNDKTSVDVVMYLLTSVFNLSTEEAAVKTSEIDKSEKGIVYINSKEVCELKHELTALYLKKLNEQHLKQTVELYQ